MLRYDLRKTGFAAGCKPFAFKRFTIELLVIEPRFFWPRGIFMNIQTSPDKLRTIEPASIPSAARNLDQVAILSGRQAQAARTADGRGR